MKVSTGARCRQRTAPRVLWAATVVFAAACAPAEPPPPAVNLTGFPPEFRDGYAAGCESARRGITRRDEKRFAQDRQYAAGWRDGLDVCGKPRKAR